MIWLLVLTGVCGGLTIACYYSAQHGSADDFGAVLPLIFFAGLTVVFFVVYAALVFWNHRFY